jgi:hypothetical protein
MLRGIMGAGVCLFRDGARRLSCQEQIRGSRDQAAPERFRDAPGEVTTLLDRTCSRR